VIQPAGLILASLMLSGCVATPTKTIFVAASRPVTAAQPAPKPVAQPRSIDPALLAPCEVYMPAASSYGEAVRAANKRLESLQECNARLRKARAENP
jgi:hypothetical protein